VTGNITGDITGDVTGNVTAATGTTTLNNLVVNGTVDFTDTKLTNLATPTAATDAATKGYVDTAVSDVINAAPAALDTLNELAAALGDDANFATTVTDSIALKLPLAGGTMSGAIAMGTSKITGLGDPTGTQDAATKTYVDTADALKLPLAGGTMSGALAMGANKITGLGTPTATTDATTKTYVDGILGSATAAATSASNAATSESNASTSASNAATSETNAATSETNAAASYDSFDDRYLGAKATAPTLDNDGDALLTGALYFNTATSKMWVYSGTVWLETAPTATSVTVSQISDVTATATEVNYIDGVTSAIQTQLDGKVGSTYTGDVAITGELTVDSYNESYAAVTSTTNATTVSCEAGNTFTHVLTENTTFTFSAPPVTGTAYTFTLKVVQDASASGFTLTWPTSVDWPAATAPTMTATASAVDVFVFYTHDGGTTWYGFVAGQGLA